MDETTKKLLKGAESPAQQLIDAYDKTDIGMLQKELKKLESPLKEAAKMHKTVNMGQELREQILMTRAASEQIQRDTLAGAESALTLQRDVHDQIAMASSAIDHFQNGAKEREMLALHLKHAIPNLQIHIPTLYLAQQWEPMPWLRDFQRNTASIMQGLDSMFEAIRRVTEPVRRIQEAVQGFTAPIQRFVEAFQRADRARQRVEATGWLAHVTTPFEALEDVEDDAIPAMLEQHYRENWQQVKEVFLSRLDEYAIDETAKDIFRDALRAHECIIYRATAMLLIPLMERVIRKEYYGGNPPKRSTSNIEFREEVRLLDPIELCAFGFYDALDHLYEHCNSDEDAARFSSKPIPNRHAVVHGRVTYNCMCSSINMLILADFTFWLVTEIKKNKQEPMVA